MKRPSFNEINRKLKQAKEAARTRSISIVNPVSVAAEALELDVTIEEIPGILLEIFEEITPIDYAGQYPPQRSYEDKILDCELFPFKWDSKSLGCLTYLKFTMKGNQMWLISFHRDRSGSGGN